MKRLLNQDDRAASCYFRSSVEAPYRKALVKITERCNLFCAHCFVSAGNFGVAMDMEAITRLLIPRLQEMRVVSVTLTGGEPFAHPDVVEIVRLMRNHGMSVSICTNATLVTDEQIETLASMGGVHINVSLDGFRAESHGKFRGSPNSFQKTVETAEKFGNHGLLKGLLVTPNTLSEIKEYGEICDFAISNKAVYVLMNPLSNFGRGAKSTAKLGSPEDVMEQISDTTDPYRDRVELVNIRFPGNRLPLSACEAGNIIYVFTKGEVTVCPYLVFAAQNPNSQHSPQEFVVGNVFNDNDIADKLDKYDFHARYVL